MPKARTPQIEIRFGGEIRHLLYDYNALAELQDLAGTYHSESAHLKFLRNAVWAGLLAETLDSRGRETERTLTLIQVGDILADMEEPEIQQLTDAVNRARTLSEPPADQRPTPAAVPTSE